MARSAWAAMRDNYRRMFKEKYGSAFSLSDDTLDEIIIDVGSLPTSKEQDEEILMSMAAAMEQ